MILSVCEEPDIMNVMRIVILLIKILRVAVPIILIIVMMIRLVGAMTKHDDAALTKAMKSVVSNIIAAVLIFLVPSFVDIVVRISAPDSDYTKCISDITIETVNEAYNKKMDKLISAAESSLVYSDYSSAYAYLQNIKDSTKKQEYEAKLDAIKELIDKQSQPEKPDNSTPTPITGGVCEYKIEGGKTKVTVKDAQGALSYTYQYGGNGVDSTSNTYVIDGEHNDVVVVIRGKEEDKVVICTKAGTEIFQGTKYDVSEEDLQFLANVGYCEQGNSVDGVKAEMTLAANLFELSGKYSTVVSYVRSSGWFSCAKTTKKASAELVEATRDVIVNGNRTMPLYINEHDCSNCSGNCSNGTRGDICQIVVDGKTYDTMDEIKDRSNYIKDKTVIYNKYGSVYTFYSFPCEHCDPFGYTASAYKKRMEQQQQQQQQQSSDSGKLKIYYLGLGRYDGFLILGNNTTLFIDGGYVSQGKKAIEFIKSLGITRIDGLIGSHMHNNHIDAHKEFIKQLSVGRVYYGENPGECQSKKTCIKGESDPDELMNLINSNNIPMTILTVGNNVKIGNLTFDIVAPEKFVTSGKYPENYNSLNMILKFGNNKFYFSGDYVGGSDILKKYDASTLDVDIFKWPHHGQMDVSNKFLDVLTPSYIIVPNSSIASQAQNGINHTKAKGYATGTDGYILAESDGNTLTVNKVSKR